MIAFIDFIEQDNSYIGGYLGTDYELIPIAFMLTDPIKQPKELEKILYGEKFELKWFGDMIAGTLYEGFKKKENSPDIEAIFISDKRMLHLRRKTEEIPVVYIGKNNQIEAYEKFDKDIQTVNSILKKINQPNLMEVFDRIKAGIQECRSSQTSKT